MNLFIALDDCIVKYKVDFDRDKLLKIREDIITNCCHFKNRRITTGVPNAFESDTDYVVNSMTETGINSGLYSLNYYEIVYPNIVNLIDRLLNGDASAVIEIESYEDERGSLKKKIDTSFDEFYEMDSSDKMQVKNKIREISALLEESGINENEESVDKYVDELNASIKLTEICKISNKKANLFFDFFGDEIKDAFVKKLV